MNADLLAMLGGAGPSSVATRRESEGKTILTFKAGKMNTTLQPNGKYLITPDPRRGTINLVWHSNGGTSSSTNSSNSGLLKFEWTDRRTRTTVDSLSIFSVDNVTYTKIDTGRPKDRVYLLQFGTSTNNMYFYWMQDKEDGNEDEDNCVKINMYAADPTEAKNAANGGTSPRDSAATEAGAEGGDDDSGGSTSSASRTTTARRNGGLDMTGLGGGGLDNAALMQILGGLNNRPSSDSDPASTDTDNATSTNPSTGATTGQVDALSNILENLGMPQPSSTSTATPATPAPTTTSATPATAEAPTAPAATPAAPNRPDGKSRGLTLSDLQGAMATLATASPPSAAGMPGPPLDQIATSEAVLSSGLLEDEEVKKRLIELLPDGQRSEERLMENLRSPQVVQCLKSLTGAICDDGGAEGLRSILANFQLSEEDGADAMAMGNPIQAFLDCVLKSVEREKKEKGSGEKGDEGNNDGDAEMSG